jgi:hypothetical protein
MSTPADRLNLSPLEKGQLMALEDKRLDAGDQLSIDADKAMRSLAVGQHTGMALDLIYDNLEELEEQYKRDDFSPEEWKRESPGFAKYAALHPFHLSVLQMDAENLTKWERNARAISLSLDSTWAMVEANKIGARRALDDFREGDLERLAEYEKLMQPHEYGAESGWAKVLVWGAKQWGPQWYTLSNAADEMALGMAAGALTGGLLAAPAAPPTMGVSEIIGIGGGIATGGFVGWRVGLARGGYDMISGESYNRYIRAGFTHENAKVAARAAGVIGAIAEPFGINQMLKYLPGGRQLTQMGTRVLVEKITGDVLRKRTVRAATGKLFLRYGEVMGSEIMVEMFQDSAMTVGQNILAQVEDKPDAYITREMWIDQMGETIVETAKALILMAGAGPVSSYAGDFVKARRANNLRIAYKALGEAAKDSKLRKSVPSKYREFVENASGSIKTIFLNIERFETYFQEIGLDPDKVATDLGINLEEARTHGTDLEIPVGIFAEKIAASEHFDPLSMDLKTDIQQMSGREAETYLANATELERAWALGEPPATHQPVQEIIDRVRNDLMANVGYDFSAASKLAMLEEMRFSVAAEYAGLDTLEFFNERWGGVQREIDTTGEAINVDLRIDPLLDLLRAEKGPKQLDIYGMSMVEWLIKKGGLQDQGGELSAMDAQIEFKNLIQDAGMTLDEAAELAVQAGYIAERDPNIVIEAIRNEIAGKPAYGFGADPAAASLARDLDELSEILTQNELDVRLKTNEEIRKALAGSETLYQDEIIETPGAMPDNILEAQDFRGINIIEPVQISGYPGDIVGLSQPAQPLFEGAVKRLRSMQELFECVRA